MSGSTCDAVDDDLQARLAGERGEVDVVDATARPSTSRRPKPLRRSASSVAATAAALPAGAVRRSRSRAVAVAWPSRWPAVRTAVALRSPALLVDVGRLVADQRVGADGTTGIVEADEQARAPGSAASCGRRPPPFRA